MAEHKATLPMWARILAVIVGVLSLAAAGIVLLEPVIGLFVMVIFLGLALLFIGMDRLVAGSPATRTRGWLWSRSARLARPTATPARRAPLRKPPLGSPAW